MEIAFLLKIAGVGIMVGVICQVLNKSGRDEQAVYVTIGGILIALAMLLSQIGSLYQTLVSIFGL